MFIILVLAEKAPERLNDAAKSGQTKTSSIVNQEVASKVPAAAQGAIPKEPSMHPVVQRNEGNTCQKLLQASARLISLDNGHLQIMAKVGSYVTAIMNIRIRIKTIDFISITIETKRRHDTCTCICVY